MFNVIEWAERGGMTFDLIDGAVRSSRAIQPFKRHGRRRSSGGKVCLLSAVETRSRRLKILSLSRLFRLSLNVMQ